MQYLRLRRTGAFLVVAAALAVSQHPALGDPAFGPLWVVQHGGADHDVDLGVSADGFGSVYIAGGAFSGFERSSGYLSRYSASGQLKWTAPLATGDYDTGYDVSADGAGHVYVAAGRRFIGSADAYVSKYNDLGSLIWTTPLQLSPYIDSRVRGVDISADSLGNIYVSGGVADISIDAFISKYDSTGALQWTRQLGTPVIDFSYDVSADSLGNVYISGATIGSLESANQGGWDAFVAKYDAGGNLLWARQFGSSRIDISHSVSTDGLGNVYVAGETIDNLGDPTGAGGAFVKKYDGMGTLIWTRQYRSSHAINYSVSADRLGNVFVTGDALDSLGGPNAGDWDVFVTKYDAWGTLLAISQVGTIGSDSGLAINADGRGSAYIAGFTTGSLSGPNAGLTDAFIAKFGVPEPTPFVHLVIAGLSQCLFPRSMTARPSTQNSRLRSAD